MKRSPITDAAEAKLAALGYQPGSWRWENGRLVLLIDVDVALRMTPAAPMPPKPASGPDMASVERALADIDRALQGQGPAQQAVLDRVIATLDARIAAGAG